MDRKQRTVELQRSGGLNCAQAIITSFGEEFGISSDTARSMGRPWGGGIGHRGETCGYLTGAVQVLARAFDHPDEEKARAESQRAVQALFQKFMDRRGTTLCRELLGADLSTEAGLQKVKREGLVKIRCCGDDSIGGDVAEILEDILQSRR
jgi:C_GCAxxG_C_C family probable redox protein